MARGSAKLDSRLHARRVQLMHKWHGMMRVQALNEGKVPVCGQEVGDCVAGGHMQRRLPGAEGFQLLGRTRERQVRPDSAGSVCRSTLHTGMPACY